MTYFLEMGEGDASDHGCEHKTRAGTTYSLKVEKEDDMSDQLQLKYEDRNDIPTGGGEGSRRVRSLL